MWPTILGGALVGAVVNVLVYAAVKKIRGEPISWKGATAAVVAGALGGAMIGSGAGILAGGGMRALGFMAANGAVTSGGETLTRNALEKKPLMEGVIADAAIGAAEAPIFFAAFGAVAKALPEVGSVVAGKQPVSGAVPEIKEAAAAVKTVAIRRIAARLGGLAIPFLRSAETHAFGASSILSRDDSREEREAPMRTIVLVDPKLTPGDYVVTHSDGTKSRVIVSRPDAGRPGNGGASSGGMVRELTNAVGR